jgi:hypothetical protein
MISNITYDDEFNFTKFRPVGPTTITELDSHTQAQLITQDYVKKALGFAKPALGLGHHNILDAVLIQVGQPQNIGGGLLRVTCTFVQGYQATYEEKIQRSVPVPGIKTSNIEIVENFTNTKDLPFLQWEYEFTTVATNEGNIQQVSRVVKTEDFEDTRTFKLPQVTLREPTSTTVTCTRTTSYGITCSPIGRKITSPESKSGFKSSSLAVSTPEIKEKTTIFSNSTNSFNEQIELLVKERIHPNSTGTEYEIPSLSSQTISEYLSEDSTPTTSGYFNLNEVQAESTIVEPVIGALNKYIDITYRPV